MSWLYDISKLRKSQLERESVLNSRLRTARNICPYEIIDYYIAMRQLNLQQYKELYKQRVYTYPTTIRKHIEEIDIIQSAFLDTSQHVCFSLQESELIRNYRATVKEPTRTSFEESHS